MLFPTLRMMLELRKNGYYAHRQASWDVLTGTIDQPPRWFVYRDGKLVAEYSRLRFFEAPEFRLIDEEDETLRQIGKKYAGSNPSSYFGREPDA